MNMFDLNTYTNRASRYVKERERFLSLFGEVKGKAKILSYWMKAVAGYPGSRMEYVTRKMQSRVDKEKKPVPPVNLEAFKKR